MIDAQGGEEMNKQRKVVITVTYNEMGMIIDTKAEELGSSVQPEIIYCKDCKHNPKNEWLGCPMAHLSEQQRPKNAWCWKGERREQ